MMSQVEEIVGRSRLRVEEMYGDVYVIAHWDDLNPEPERTERKEELKRVQREIFQYEGLDAGDIQTEYGRAKMRVIEEEM